MIEHPIAKFSAGQVSCAVWKHVVSMRDRPQPVVVMRVTVERRFKDRSGSWRSSHSLSGNELPLAIWCLQRAFDEIIRRQRGSDVEPAREELAEMLIHLAPNAFLVL